jgi:membrane-associated PAP2 superfamily phosphatase
MYISRARKALSNSSSLPPLLHSPLHLLHLCSLHSSSRSLIYLSLLALLLTFAVCLSLLTVCKYSPLITKDLYPIASQTVLRTTTVVHFWLCPSYDANGSILMMEYDVLVLGASPTILSRKGRQVCKQLACLIHLSLLLEVVNAVVEMVVYANWPPVVDLEGTSLGVVFQIAARKFGS